LNKMLFDYIYVQYIKWHSLKWAIVHEILHAKMIAKAKLV